ncbi:SMC-Scp complex subunit ScpB [Patescibacteria group bacterium]
MKLITKVESILFVATKPLTAKNIADLISANVTDTTSALDELEKILNEGERGIQLLRIGNKFQLATHPDNGKLVADYIKSEISGELTRPALETLTIIAYRGPITKAELDIIRGVNCALILRNLLIKGLIDAEENKQSHTTMYQVTFDFLRHLGVTSTSELPNYDKLSSSEVLDQLLEQELNPNQDEQTDKQVK